LEVIPKKDLRDLYGTKFVGKITHKLFWQV